MSHRVFSVSMPALAAAILATLVATHGLDAPELLAQEAAASPPVVDPSEQYKPGVLPDRIVLTWADDPRTTQSVTWRTSTLVESAVAEIALAEPGPGFPEKAQRCEAVSQTLETDLGEARYHSVTFRDLEPGTRYVYRVGDGANWSEWFQFSTASADPEPFSFIYFGDAQTNLRSMWSRVIREAYRDAPKASFLLHAGDLVNRGNADAEWGEWFAAGNWLNAMMPSVPVPGNHEHVRMPDGNRQLTAHWQAQFTLPENGPEGLSESCYTFTYHNVRIIALNSNEQLEAQTEWLEEVLRTNESQWIICTFHHPIFSTGQDRDNRRLRNAWKPLFDKYRVDLVLQGHDHSYGRTGIDTPLAIPTTTSNVPTGLSNVDSASGTVYVVSVSGPKMYAMDRKPFMVRAAEDTQLYQIIHVDGGTLRYEARTANGELYDSFALRKRPEQTNELVELIPDTPERLRAEPAASAAGK